MLKKEIKAQLLNALYAPFKNCLLCPLSQQRTNVVFGKGNPDADILFIGEAPGKEEDALGLPFVGRSGKLLTNIFASLNIDTEKIYITNIVKCRPPQNRLPEITEAETCKKTLLDQQISIINPKIICALGSFAAHTLLKTATAISKLRGKAHLYRSSNVIATYHPAYILRSPTKFPLLTEDIKYAFSLLNTNGQ